MNLIKIVYSGYKLSEKTCNDWMRYHCESKESEHLTSVMQSWYT